MTVSVFLLFLALLVLCLARGWSVAWAISAGLVLFFLLGLRLGHSPAALWRMAWAKGRKSLLVLRVLVLIGVITGLWRAGGTIAFCIYYGIRLVTPKLFVLTAFLLTSAMSYILGTSFGVASTAGVIFMALARSGGVDELVAAGAVLSGVYFGDRCSPASSCASLVAAVTDTALYRNVRQMLKTGLLPTALTALLYLFLSFRHPVTGVDAGVMEALAAHFRLSWPALLPAAAMLLLPVLKVPIVWAMGASILLAALAGAVLQGFSLPQLLEIAVLGYHPAEGVLAPVLSGGGMVDMAPTYVTVMATGLYSGILEGTGLLRPLEERLLAGVERLGRLPVTLGASLLGAMVFCNQSVAVILTEQLMRRAYTDREELAMDIENTGVTVSGLVPWSIACSIPLSMLGVGYGALPYAALLYLIPLCWLATKGRFYPNKPKKRV